jgi:hypothetical protein
MAMQWGAEICPCVWSTLLPAPPCTVRERRDQAAEGGTIGRGAPAAAHGEGRGGMHAGL